MNNSIEQVLERLIISKLVKIFPAIYGVKMFVTMFTIACHWSLS